MKKSVNCLLAAIVCFFKNDRHLVALCNCVIKAEIRILPHCPGNRFMKASAHQPIKEK